jgi:hypothetical protein
VPSWAPPPRPADQPRLFASSAAPGPTSALDAQTSLPSRLLSVEKQRETHVPT